MFIKTVFYVFWNTDQTWAYSLVHMYILLLIRKEREFMGQVHFSLKPDKRVRISVYFSYVEIKKEIRFRTN